MPSQIGRLKWVFLAIFFTFSMAITAWQWLYVIPRQKCEAKHWWWSEKYRECDQPLRIVDMPGYHRVLPAPDTSASASSAASK